MFTRVVGLYVHSDRSSRPEDTTPMPMLAMPRVDAVTDRGIRQDRRYFRRPDPGRVRPRQVSLIDEGTILRHAERFGPIDRSLVKAQIILEGDVYLPDLLGSRLVFEDGPEFVLSLERDPCFAMDLIAFGLRQAMEGGQQGALARVTADGPIWVGQAVNIEVSSTTPAVVEASR
jgi:hypothetical protein